MYTLVEQSSHPAISVLMTAYNSELFIRKAIQSVLDQTFSDFELIVYNDGSTDRTVAVVKEFADPRIRLLSSEKNRGVTYARQTTLSLAKGKYVAILDSDDIAFPTRLEKQYKFLETHPDVKLCGGNAVVIDEKGNHIVETLIPFYRPEELKVKLFFNNIFVNSTVMYRREEVLSLGGYRDRVLAEDYDLFVRLANLYEIYILTEEFLVYYRLHSNNISQTKRNKIIEEVREIKREQLAFVGIRNIELYLPSIEALTSRQFRNQSIEDFYGLLVELKQANLKTRKLPQKIFEKELFSFWYSIVTSTMPKNKRVSYLLRKELFRVSFTSFKQKRRIFKFWLRSLFS